LRAGGSGVPAFFTKTGAGTVIETGEWPIKFKPGTIEAAVPGIPRDRHMFNGEAYILEQAIKTDFGIVKAWKGDTMGNLVYRTSARNFNPLVAMSSDVAIAEVEELVEPGELDPDFIHTPGVHVNRIVKGARYKKPIERLTVDTGAGITIPGKGEAKVKRERIIRRSAKELKDGMYVNLGIGMPTLASNFVEPGIRIVMQSENGLLGMGPYPKTDAEDPDLINAGKETVTLIKGASTFSSAESFAMIRAGKVDITILGGL
jgi:3-oxoacid CoA-transferase